MWDNGHAQLKYHEKTFFHDLDGNLVGKVNFHVSQSAQVDSLPATFNIQGTVTCVGTGLVDPLHFGITIDENGNFHEHGVFI